MAEHTEMCTALNTVPTAPTSAGVNELSHVPMPELCEMEDHHMQEMTSDHAQYQTDESEGVGEVPVQRRCGQDASDIQYLEPEVHETSHLHNRRERLWPSNRQCVQHAQHLEEGHELAANDGNEHDAVHLHGLVLARNDAINAPKYSQYEDDGANQHTHVGTATRL